MIQKFDIAHCPDCGGNLKFEKVPNHIYKGFGFPVVLINAVSASTCESCGEVEHSVPNLPGLMAAVAVQRVMLPYKFTGSDIRFVRKAIGGDVSSAQLAKHLDVTPETFSRWENDKLVISGTTEKLLRIVVGLMLKDKAPAMEFDIEAITDLQINAAWGIEEKFEDMVFELVRIRTPNKRVEEGYLLQEAA